MTTCALNHGLAGLDRRGAHRLFAPTTVSIDAVRVPTQAPRHPELIALLAAHAWHHAKHEQLGFHVVTVGGKLPEPAV